MAPELGQHTDEVLRSLLELDDDFPAMLTLLREREALKFANGSDYNRVSWYSLLVDADLKVARDLAEKGFEASGSKNLSILHTLATLEAELGNVDQAHRRLQELLKNRTDSKPHKADWYVVGRLAENLELRDTAIWAYLRVPEPENAKYPYTTYNLASQRIAKLGAKRPKKKNKNNKK